MVAEVRLGVAAWDRPDWPGRFYPAGLPQEWRLAYYCSQYSCAWLGEADLRGLTPARAETWLEDTNERFRFVLDTSARVEGDVAAVLAILRPRLAPVDGRS